MDSIKSKTTIKSIQQKQSTLTHKDVKSINLNWSSIVKPMALLWNKHFNLKGCIPLRTDYSLKGCVKNQNCWGPDYQQYLLLIVLFSLAQSTWGYLYCPAFAQKRNFQWKNLEPLFYLKCQIFYDCTKICDVMCDFSPRHV